MSRWDEEYRFGVRTKADGTPVTDADEAAERAIREEIEKRYPGHVVLGEEEGASGSGAQRWIIDPIDGTKAYASGIPIWATLVALEIDGEIVCGVASAPALGERYAAAAGQARPATALRSTSPTSPRSTAAGSSTPPTAPSRGRDGGRGSTS
jgi:fructose-1,6-bisphosphatase/inositol monophosphatase family enzyme